MILTKRVLWVFLISHCAVLCLGTCFCLLLVLFEEQAQNFLWGLEAYCNRLILSSLLPVAGLKYFIVIFVSFVQKEFDVCSRKPAILFTPLFSFVLLLPFVTVDNVVSFILLLLLLLFNFSVLFVQLKLLLCSILVHLISHHQIVLG